MAGSRVQKASSETIVKTDDKKVMEAKKLNRPMVKNDEKKAVEQKKTNRPVSPQHKQKLQQQSKIQQYHQQTPQPKKRKEKYIYNSQGYPKFDGVEDCSFFIQNGLCKFAGNCKFNHPEYICFGIDFNSQGYPFRSDQKDCDYYMKTAECKFGCTCQFNHPELHQFHFNIPKNLAPPLQCPRFNRDFNYYNHNNQPTFNSKGLPIRPGIKLCPYHLQSGMCKYGPTCRFSHYDENDNQRIAPIESYSSKGFPVRSGSPACPFFVKTGDCKYGATCKWDHADGIEKPPRGLNSLGLPLRPGEQECDFFKRTGSCGFIGTCKFNHPEDYCNKSNSKDKENNKTLQQQQRNKENIDINNKNGGNKIRK